MEIRRSGVLSSAERTKSWSPMTSSVFQEITSHVLDCFKQKCVPGITYADGSILGQTEMPFGAVSVVDYMRVNKHGRNQGQQSSTSLQLNASFWDNTKQFAVKLSIQKLSQKDSRRGCKKWEIVCWRWNLSEYTNLMPRIFTIKTMFCYAADALTGLRFWKLVTRKLRRLNAKQNTKRQPLNFSGNSFPQKIENAAKIPKIPARSFSKLRLKTFVVINWINFSFPANFSGLMNWTLFFSQPEAI